jgi:quercetin dioxygenase-like cupin family protein
MELQREKEAHMRRLSVAATLVLAAVIACAPAVHAQPAGASKADPVKVDSRHYKVEFENEKVRVLRVSYGAGEKSVMHYNPDAVVVSLTGDKTRFTTPDGKSRDAAPSKPGSVIWAPAGSRLPQNVSDKPDEVIIVELKK